MDVSIIRMVVMSLGVIAGLCIGGMVILANNHQEVPQALSLIATGAVTALVGILAATKGDRGNDGDEDGPHK